MLCWFFLFIILYEVDILAMPENKRTCREFDLFFILSGGLYYAVFSPLSFLSFLLSGCEGQSELGRDLEGLNGVGLLWGQEPIARLASSHLKKNYLLFLAGLGIYFSEGFSFFFLPWNRVYYYLLLYLSFTWRIITLQNFAVFCQTSTRISIWCLMIEQGRVSCWF